jgi:biopolymer transport protein ExbB
MDTRLTLHPKPNTSYLFQNVKGGTEFMNQMRFFTIRIAIAALTVLILFAGAAVIAQENGTGFEPEQEPDYATFPAAIEAVDEDSHDKTMSIFQLIMKGGVVGGLIILLSCVALGLIIDYAVTIRKEKLAPSDHIITFKKLITERKIKEAMEMAGEKPSFLSNILSAGLSEINQGYQAMIKAMEDSAEAMSSGLARKIEHLNVIGNISPMMGLLGTVIGMLRCFNEISQVTGAIDPKQLAGGIFEALITTCLGLIVAIPTIYFYAIFRNRIDEFTGEASIAAEEIIATYKHDDPVKVQI